MMLLLYRVVKAALYHVGKVALGLGRGCVNLTFWGGILLASASLALVIGLKNKFIQEPRLIGVLVYLIIGAWMVYSLLFGVGSAPSRIPAGF